MKLFSIIEGIALGALGMYLMDPDRGTRRRALVRDQLVHQAAKKRRAARVMARDFSNRVQGFRAEIQNRFDHSDVGDETLAERVRSVLGRCVSHSGSIQVKCDQGCVVLSGLILASEVDECLAHAIAVPGVKSIVNEMDLHANADHISGLQGGKPPLVQDKWTPAMCLVMSVAGGLLSLYGVRKQGISGGAMMVVGAGMMAKAFNDTERRFEPSNRALPKTGTGEKTNTESKRSQSAVTSQTDTLAITQHPVNFAGS